MNKNKLYFQRTFKIIHAPDNLTQEVLNMAKSLEDKNFQNNTIDNTNRKLITTTVEVKSHRFDFKGLAIACCCIAIVGGSILAFGNINQSNNDIVSSKIENGIGVSQTSYTTDIRYNLFGIFDVSSDISVDYECKSIGSTNWNTFKKSVLTDDEVKILNDNYNIVWSVVDEETYLQHNYKYTNDETNATQKCSLQFETVDDEYINIFMINGVMQISYFEKGGINLKSINYYQCNDIETFNLFLDIIRNITIENPLVYTMGETAEKNSTLASEIEQEKLDEKNSITYLEILDTMKEKSNELIYIGQFNDYNDGMDLNSGETNQDIINELYYMLSSHTYEVDTVYAIYDTTDEGIIISNKEFSLGYRSINFDETGINFIVKSNGKIIYPSSNDYYVLTPTDGSNLYPNVCKLLDKNIENPQTEQDDTPYIIID